MKVIIDIPEEVKTDIEDIYYTGRDIPHENISTLLKTIVNGTPIPDNATNREVIEAMFPNLKIANESLHNDNLTGILAYYGGGTVKRNNHYFARDWWNAPYNGVENDKN